MGGWKASAGIPPAAAPPSRFGDAKKNIQGKSCIYYTLAKEIENSCAAQLPRQRIFYNVLRVPRRNLPAFNPLHKVFSGTDLTASLDVIMKEIFGMAADSVLSCEDELVCVLRESLREVVKQISLHYRRCNFAEILTIHCPLSLTLASQESANSRSADIMATKKRRPDETLEGDPSPVEADVFIGNSQRANFSQIEAQHSSFTQAVLSQASIFGSPSDQGTPWKSPHSQGTEQKENAQKKAKKTKRGCRAGKNVQLRRRDKRSCGRPSQQPNSISISSYRLSQMAASFSGFRSLSPDDEDHILQDNETCLASATAAAAFPLAQRTDCKENHGDTPKSSLLNDPSKKRESTVGQRLLQRMRLGASVDAEMHEAGYQSQDDNTYSSTMRNQLHIARIHRVGRHSQSSMNAASMAEPHKAQTPADVRATGAAKLPRAKPVSSLFSPECYDEFQRPAQCHDMMGGAVFSASDTDTPSLSFFYGASGSSSSQSQSHRKPTASSIPAVAATASIIAAGQSENSTLTADLSLSERHHHTASSADSNFTAELHAQIERARDSTCGYGLHINHRPHPTVVSTLCLPYTSTVIHSIL
jgi:hypothetical protein